MVDTQKPEAKKKGMGSFVLARPTWVLLSLKKAYVSRRVS